MGSGSAKIVVLAGGSFQGKSLISLAVASHFSFSGVLTTDAVRNVAKVLNPDKPFLSTSTYLLTHDRLEEQKRLVSNVIRDVIPIYQMRGEHIVIEGMHFSKQLLKLFAAQGFCRLFINNQAPFPERVLLKQTTRVRLRLVDGSSGQPEEFSRVKDARDTLYYAYQERIQEIHHELQSDCMATGFHVIDFDDIDEGARKVTSWVSDWFRGGLPNRGIHL